MVGIRYSRIPTAQTPKAAAFAAAGDSVVHRALHGSEQPLGRGDEIRPPRAVGEDLGGGARHVPGRVADVDDDRVRAERQHLFGDWALPGVTLRVADDEHDASPVGRIERQRCPRPPTRRAPRLRADPAPAEARRDRAAWHPQPWCARGHIRRRTRGARASRLPRAAAPCGLPERPPNDRAAHRPGIEPTTRPPPSPSRRSASLASVSRLRAPPRRSRVDALSCLVLEVVAEEQRVGAGGERLHRALLDADRGAEALHLERVGDHHARRSRAPRAAGR